MKWAIIGVLSLAVFAALIVFVASRKPSTISISRSVTINAPSQTVFALVNDLHNWPQWAPQDHEDRTMKRGFSGAASGAGAISTWTSKGSAGKGQMKISSSVPNAQIQVLVDFSAPFVAHNVNTFTFERLQNGTQVTWSMQGTNVFMLKLVSVFVTPERMLGPHFENGLKALKSVAERRGH